MNFLKKIILLKYLKCLLKTIIVACIFMFASIFTTMAQIRVTGSVTDVTGGAMPGVNISVRGTALGTVTDVNGEYSINVPRDTCVLQFHYIGFEDQNIVVGNKRVIAIAMKESSAELGEVTVVAFAKQKK
jgi:hypothetical protein